MQSPIREATSREDLRQMALALAKSRQDLDLSRSARQWLRQAAEQTPTTRRHDLELAGSSQQVVHRIVEQWPRRSHELRIIMMWPVRWDLRS
jgi:hypothetical protein